MKSGTPPPKVDELSASLLQYFRTRKEKYKALAFELPIGNSDRAWYLEKAAKCQTTIETLEELVAEAKAEANH